MDCQKIIDQIYLQVTAEENLGQVAAYIPELGKVDPEKFGICMTTIKGRQLKAGEALLDGRKTKRINAIMQTCGFYDEAGEFAYRVGLPGKSGVGGGIAAILPNEYAMAVWSPRLSELPIS